MNPSLVVARLIRRLLTLVWLAAMLVLIGLATWSRMADLVIVGGASMEPSLAVGSLVNPQPVAPSEIRPGDVVTVRADNGVLVTHRVVRIADLPTGRHFELRGDANPSPDPILVSAGAVIGRVDGALPAVGFVLAMMATPTGLISLATLLLAGLIAVWLIEELESMLPERRAERTRQPALGEPGRAQR